VGMDGWTSIGGQGRPGLGRAEPGSALQGSGLFLPRRTGEPGASAAAGVRCLALPCLLALLASVAEVVAVGLDLGQPGTLEVRAKCQRASGPGRPP